MVCINFQFIDIGVLAFVTYKFVYKYAIILVNQNGVKYVLKWAMACINAYHSLSIWKYEPWNLIKLLAASLQYGKKKIPRSTGAMNVVNALLCKESWM